MLQFTQFNCIMYRVLIAFSINHHAINGLKKTYAIVIRNDGMQCKILRIYFFVLVHLFQLTLTLLNYSGAIKRY